MTEVVHTPGPHAVADGSNPVGPASPLAPYWHVVARSCDVGSEPQRVRLLGENLVLFRHDDGVAAWKDVCIHRGTALSLGRRQPERGTLVCPYHGWEYDGTGRCVHIPALGEGANIPNKARAITYHCVERYDFVWVALAEPVAPVPPFHEYDDPGWRGFLGSSYEWNTSAGRATENGMDYSHVPFVHPNLLWNDPFVPRHDVVRTEDGFEYWIDGEEINAAYKQRPVRWKFRIAMPFTNDIFRINLTNDQVDILRIHSSPVAPRKTKVFLGFARNYDLDRDPADDQRLIEFEDEVFAQDRMIAESQRPEELPLSLREELHLKVPDAGAIMYRRLLSEIDPTEAFLP